MNIRRTISAAVAVAALSTIAACGALADDSTTTSASTSTASSTGQTTNESGSGQSGSGQSGPGNSIDVSQVSSETELIGLIQEAYGDPGLGLHRGHQPVESVLNEVLQISHDELHVRMEEKGQNLAVVAEDLGIDPQTLIDALVESWSPAIDSTLASGAITEDQAADYLAALQDAFEFRVTWDGAAATPEFSGIAV
ncbi:MAG: hypothetical protein V9F00_03000 [Nocardioides sp.]